VPSVDNFVVSYNAVDPTFAAPPPHPPADVVAVAADAVDAVVVVDDDAARLVVAATVARRHRCHWNGRVHCAVVVDHVELDVTPNAPEAHLASGRRLVLPRRASMPSIETAIEREMREQRVKERANIDR